jgi:hypothetical protein
VQSNLIPQERGFGGHVINAAILRKLEEGFRTVVRTGQYDRILMAHLGDLAMGSRVDYASASSFTETIWILGAVMVAVFAISFFFKFRQFDFGVRKKLNGLEERLALETEAQQNLRLALARQQLVINRMSTTTLVDQIKALSGNDDTRN